MSHLPHVITLKNALAAEPWGVTCTKAQGEAIAEAFVYALRRQCFTVDSQWTEAMTNKAWKMLDKWNNVFPIPAQQIYAKAISTSNGIRASLANTGAPPCSRQFEVNVRAGIKGEDVNVADFAEFKELVSYLVQELVNCHE